MSGNRAHTISVLRASVLWALILAALGYGVSQTAIKAMALFTG